MKSIPEVGSDVTVATLTKQAPLKGFIVHTRTFFVHPLVLSTDHWQSICYMYSIQDKTLLEHDIFCVDVMYSGEYDACDVTLSVYPHRASLKNMPGHGGNRTYDLWNTSPMLCQLSYAVRSVRVCDISVISEQNLVPAIPM